MTVFRDCICILLLYYRYESKEWPACGIYRTVNRNSPWENRLTMSGALSSVDVHADSPGPTRTQCACSFCHCSPPLDILQLPQLCGISKENKRTYLPHMESDLRYNSELFKPHNISFPLCTVSFHSASCLPK